MARKIMILTILLLFISVFASSITLGKYEARLYNFNGELFDDDIEIYSIGFNPDLEIYYLYEGEDYDSIIYILKDDLIQKKNYQEFYYEEEESYIRFYDNYLVYFYPEDYSAYIKAVLKK